MGNLIKLQERINYHFNDIEILKQALRHSSYINEKRMPKILSNERLEFLGDAVLELVSSEYFFNKYDKKTEGELTKLRAKNVCEISLNYIAKNIELGTYIYLGKGEEATGGRNRSSLLSDALEALVGAIFLDGGFANAKEFILEYILKETQEKDFFYDSKTILQEETQKMFLSSPKYMLVSSDGPDHSKTFTVKVLINEEDYSIGTGTSKKSAEQEAAYLALKRLGKV